VFSGKVKDRFFTSGSPTVPKFYGLDGVIVTAKGKYNEKMSLLRRRDPRRGN